MILQVEMNRNASHVKDSMIIYKVTNLINGKVYIGKTTKSLEARQRGHHKESKAGRGNSIFHKAIRKYGIESFIWEILGQYKTISDLDAAEIEFIRLYESCDTGYNITSGGGGITGYKHTEKTKEKIGSSSRGKKLHTETIDKMRIAKSKQWQDPEYHKKQVDAAKARWTSQSELDEQSIRRGSKKFEIIKDGLVIWSGFNKRQAGRLFNLDATAILRCLQGRFNQHRGYTFRYVNG